MNSDENRVFRLVLISISILFSFTLIIFTTSRTQTTINHVGLRNYSPRVSLMSSNPDSISLVCNTYGFSYETVSSGNVESHKIEISECQNTTRIGYPSLPYITQLIAIPECSDVKLEIDLGELIEIDGINAHPAVDLASREDSNGWTSPGSLDTSYRL